MTDQQHDHAAEGLTFYSASPTALREHMREHHGWPDDDPFNPMSDHGANMREHLAEHYQWFVDRAHLVAIPLFEADDAEAAD